MHADQAPHALHGPVSAARPLLSFYASAISFGLAVDAQIGDAHARATGAEAQQRMRRLVERANGRAAAQGTAAADLELATFALVAWFDEIAARRTDWVDAAAPLQLTWFNTTNAATEFFHQLGALQPHQGEVRELYWYLLTLGFKGQYYFESAAAASELAKLKALHRAHLLRAPLDLNSPSAVLSPQLHAYPTPPPRPPMRALGSRRSWLLAAWTFAGIAAVSHLAAIALSAANPQSQLSQINQLLQQQTCASLRAHITQEKRIQIEGYVPDEAARTKLQADMQRATGSNHVSLDVSVRPWPYCEVVDILQAHQARNERMRQGLRVTAKAVEPNVLREGEPIRFQVHTPARDGVLWVDLYTADGAVLHLNAGGRHKVAYRAGETLTFGEDIPTSWVVGPPFGPVLVTVIAEFSSDVPTAPLSQPHVESAPYELATAYLLRLRAALDKPSPKALPLADTLFLHTRER